MAIAIQPYTEDRIAAVKAFNQRLAAGGVGPEFHFPESHIPYWLPPVNGRRLYQEYYVALEGETVRGAFILKYQDFSFSGATEPLVYYHLPVSEGIVNKSYASVGVLMLRSAMKMRPMLFALGMGGFDRPLPTMLKAMGWSLSAAPFYFRVNHPARFLRQIAPLRQSSGRRALATIAAFSGAGYLGIKAAQQFRTMRCDGTVRTEAVKSFGSWADELWQSSAARYPLVADRSSTALNVLYPPDRNFLCLKIMRGAETLGWAVLLDTQMRDNKYFGNLRVGTIADAFGAPENAREIIQAATEFLAQQGVDLTIANHSNTLWGNAFRSNGYFQGPSNFIFAASKPLAGKLAPVERNLPNLYFMRGDGDGPVNL
jgi:hypothetical protein